MHIQYGAIVSLDNPHFGAPWGIAMATEKISKIFMDRIDNTDDIDVLQGEISIMRRIEYETTDENVREEMDLKIRYVRKRIDVLRGKERGSPK